MQKREAQLWFIGISVKNAVRIYNEGIEMTTQMELRRLGLSRREVRAIRHTAEMYAKEASRQNDRLQPGWRKQIRKERAK